MVHPVELSIKRNNFLFIYIDEEDIRRGIFETNVDFVRRGQLEFDTGARSYDLRINCFGDLSFEEFGKQRLGFGTLAGETGKVVKFMLKSLLR